MKVEFHPKAVEKFNESANNLLFFLLPKKYANKLPIPKFKTDVPTIDLKMPKEFISSSVNEFGDKVDCFFNFNNQLIGLDEEKYKDLIKLAHELQKNKTLKNSVSEIFIRDKIFIWMKEKYQNLTRLELIEFIQRECNNEIKHHEIYIPIEMTEIEQSLIFGRVEIIEFNKEIIDYSISELTKDKSTQESELTNKIFDEIRNRYQGKAVGVFKIEAEIILAEELAFHELNKSLSLLRFFHRASISPASICYTSPSGYSKLNKKSHFHVEDGVITKTTNGFANKFEVWSICKNSIEEFKKNGLSQLHTLLITEKNEFQNKLQESLLIFSRCSTTLDYADKLISLVVSLESFLLKNDTESIQTNIAERIAFTISDNVNERIKIVKIVKEAYSLRSRFLHHGKSIDDLKLFEEFMVITWTFYYFLINNMSKFQTVTEYIHWIEEKKYS